jgi:hypothetical protein
MTTHLAKQLTLVAAVSLLAPAIAQADSPGSYFLDFPERMALVVDATGKAPKAMISEDAARAITAGAQPVSGASIILIYQGNLYIVPDKRLGDGKMASDMVRSSASNAGK